MAWCVRQKAITWANVDPDLCCHMALHGHYELMFFPQRSLTTTTTAYEQESLHKRLKQLRDENSKLVAQNRKLLGQMEDMGYQIQQTNLKVSTRSMIIIHHVNPLWPSDAISWSVWRHWLR